MPLLVPDLERILSSRGYIALAQTTKKKAFRKAAQSPLYLNLSSKAGVTSLITHPGIAAQEIADRVPGARVAPSYYHSSNMRMFPTRLHRGQKPIPYGWGVTFDSERAANAFFDCMEGLVDAVALNESSAF